MSRLRLWVTLLTTSVVTLVSLLSVLDDRQETEWTRQEKWAVSVASISITFSFFGALASLLPPKTSHRLEVLVIAITLGFWSAGLPAIVDPDNNLAVSPTYAIANANLFFFSYASLLFCILLLGSWVEELRGDEASPTRLQWLLLAALSITVMCASVTIFRSQGCKNVDSKPCNRNRFAVFLGMATALFSLLCVAASKRAPLEFQGGLSFLLIVCWACGVSYITFGSGPGTQMGSLYFATWAAFFLTISITTTAVKTVIEERHITVTIGAPASAPETAAPATTAPATEAAAADAEAQVEKE